MTEAWSDWLRDTTGAGSARDIAKRLGRSHTTVLRWMRDGVPPERVISIAIDLNADVIDALIAAGWLASEDVPRLVSRDLLKRVPTPTLIAELSRRAASGTLEFHQDTQNRGH